MLGGTTVTTGAAVRRHTTALDTTTAVRHRQRKSALTVGITTWIWQAWRTMIQRSYMIYPNFTIPQPQQLFSTHFAQRCILSCTTFQHRPSYTNRVLNTQWHMHIKGQSHMT